MFVEIKIFLKCNFLFVCFCNLLLRADCLPLHQLAREDLVRDRAFRHAAGAIRSREEILDVVDDSIVISEKSGGIAQAPGEMRMPQWQGPAGVYAVGGRDGISARRRQTDDRHLGERTHG